MDKTSLLEWYFAGLRKQALTANLAHDLTPMALIKADQDLLKERIELELKDEDKNGSKENSNFSESSRNTGTKNLSTALSTDLSGFTLSLLVIAILGFLLTFLGASVETSYLLRGVFILAACVSSILLLNIRKQRSIIQDFSETFGAGSSANLTLAQNPNKDSSGMTRANSMQMLAQTIDRLHDDLQLMKQKELLTFDYCPHILCELDEEGTIRTLNRTAEKTWGYTAKSLLNTEIGDRLHFDSIEVLFESLSRCKRMGRPETVEIATLTKSGSIVHLAWRSEWSTSANAYYCMAEDITIRVEHENLKTEMRQMLTHDLKAPINNLSMWTYNMLYGSYGEIPPDASVSLKKTQNNLQAILTLLENLLDVDKLESGMMPVNKKVFSIQESVDKTAQLLSDWAREAGVTLQVESSDFSVMADEQQVTRILTNFCSNAIKWTPPNGVVTIKCRSEDNRVIIEVADTGPGIPDEVKGRLFERWTSTEGSEKQSIRGTGIGLYMTKKFAELQGGSVGAEAREGGGSSFSLSVPLAK